MILQKLKFKKIKFDKIFNNDEIKRDIMNARVIAEKNILKRKLHAEEVADMNLNKVLQNEDAKIIFVKCKKLIVEIAKLEVDGQDASELRNQYNEAGQLLSDLLKDLGYEKSDLKPKYTCTR